MKQESQLASEGDMRVMVRDYFLSPENLSSERREQICEAFGSGNAYRELEVAGFILDDIKQNDPFIWQMLNEFTLERAGQVCIIRLVLEKVKGISTSSTSPIPVVTSNEATA